MKIIENRPRESKPQSKFVWVMKAKGHKFYMYVGAMMLQGMTVSRIRKKIYFFVQRKICCMETKGTPTLF